MNTKFSFPCLVKCILENSSYFLNDSNGKMFKFAVSKIVMYEKNTLVLTSILSIH